MFRYDSFRQSESPDPSTSSSTKTERGGLAAQPSTMPSNNGDNKSINFLQRMASADTLLRSTSSMKRPSFSSLQSSFSSSSTSSLTSSFSIPVPTNSWGMLALSRLRAADDGEFDDIIDLLLTREKAMLLLPVSQPTLPSAIIDREFIQDHVIVYQGNHDQVISLSGIRGLFQNDQFVAVGLLPSEKEVSAIMSGSPAKKSLFDTFSLDPTSINSDCPKYNILASHVQLPLREDKSITVMLIQKPISKAEVTEWTESQKHKGQAVGSLNIKNLSNTVGQNPRVSEFIKTFRKRPPRNLDLASGAVLDLLDGFFDDMDDEKIDDIESYICYELYDCLFSTPGGDESLQDEALESRIAALNLLDLNMEHLGVIVEDESETEDIETVVKEAGLQLQQLNSIPDAKGKLSGLVKTHQIIVDAIEGFAEKYRKTKLDGDLEVVQEMKHAMSTVNEEESHKPSTSKPTSDETTSIEKEPEIEKEKETVGLSEPLNVDTASTTSSIDKKLPAVPSPDVSVSTPTSDHQSLRSASADVLLPLLIFTIVKSNPTNFLSNLRFIQRFRRPSRIAGQESYCLTNIMAAVSFLETTNLVGLGLSADKVLSHVTDFNTPAVPPKPNSLPPSPQQHQQQQRHLDGGGLKLMSDVMDSSYRMFDGIGKLWQRDGGVSGGSGKGGPVPLSNSTSSSSGSMMDQVINRVRATSATESELKDMPSGSIPKEAIKESRSRSRPDAAFHALLQAPSQFIHSVNNPKNNVDGPLQKFLDKKSVDELKIGEVAELLADYKRLAAIIKQANLS
ncbi:hypothetical protein BDA99DRAFT_522029 [Phascolomyces articulosus]|uniref:VPS9 domain-containing protein n=1 Tax=Phascolomyces articulosus TaxID=60185 RepID=A0AAD5JSH2_9FUNG|nr:hypothetical protein BDA99DRAFT_522029 [Phascolomyces articulosus]